MDRIETVALAALALSLSLTLGCHAARPDVERTPADPPPAVGSGGIDQASAEAVVEEISARVAELRGLEFLDPVPVQVISDEQIRGYMLERIEQMEMEESMRALETAYRHLGLVPDGIDTFDILVGALEEQAGGFYDPQRDSYYLLDDMPQEMTGVITAHELVHALEDQHFDLDARTKAVIRSDDKAFAVSAVHEGSATLVMTLFATEEILAGRMDAGALSAPMPTEALDALPTVFARQMIGPYVLGMQFLLRGNPMGIAAGMPLDDLKTVFADGPLSSEQILHPEKYWDEALRDDPLSVAPTAAGIPNGWSATADGELGELVLAVLVDPDSTLDPQQMALGGGAAWTHEAAMGWGGDRWQLLENGERSLLRVRTVWDSETDAEEFSDALAGRAALRTLRRGSEVAVVASKDLDEAELDRWAESLASLLPVESTIPVH